MNARQTWYPLLFLWLIALCTSTAQAGMKFGSTEKIQHVASVELKGPKGESLFLGRLVEEKHFALPYTIEDRGFVLGVSGEPRYFDLPRGEELEHFQRAGKLPKPLPPYHMDVPTLLLGHALWIALAIFAAYLALKTLLPKKSATLELPANEALATQESPPLLPNTPAPELPIILYPSKKKSLLFLLGAIVFVVIGIAMAEQEPLIGYGGAAFFGLCGLAFALQLALPKRSYLKLTAEGFTIAGFLKTSSYRWNEVSPLAITRISGNKMVGWRTQGRDKQIGASLSIAMTGVHGVIPANYRIPPEQLVELMNTIRNHCLRMSGSN